MSVLAYDQDVDVVRLTIPLRDGLGSAVEYWLAREYYPASGLWSSGVPVYTGNPIIYPLLASPPEVRRGVGHTVSLRYTTNVVIHAQTHFDVYGKTFWDLYPAYSFQNALVELLYTGKPADAAVAYTEANAVREVMKVVGFDYDEQTGLLTLRCSDFWFNDKIFSKQLTTDDFTTLTAALQGEVGAICFGQSSTAGLGVVFDAPIVDNNFDSNSPYLYLFGGWGYARGIGNHSCIELYVKNQHKEQDDTEWLAVDRTPNFDVAWNGQDGAASPPTYNGNTYAQSLSHFARARVVSPVSKAVILSAVSTTVQPLLHDKAADIDTDCYLRSDDPDGLSIGEADFEIEFWVYFTALTAGTDVMIMSQGTNADSSMEWLVYLPSGGATQDKITFAISANGTTIANSVSWSSAASASTWYHVVCWHDATNNDIKIKVNDGTTQTTAHGANAMVRRSGYFTIGLGTWTSYAAKRFYINRFRFWRNLRDDTERTARYNSGKGIAYEAFTAANKTGLRAALELYEPAGVRSDYNGGLKMDEVGAPVEFFYPGPGDIVVDADNGVLECVISHCEYVGANDSWQEVGAPLRRAILDVGSSNIQAGNVCYFQIEPALVMSADANYLIELNWTNDDTDLYEVLAEYESSSGKTTYARAKRTENKSWQKQADVDIGLGLYALGGGVIPDVTGDDGYAGDVTFGPYSGLMLLQGKAITLSGSQVRLLLGNALEFKLGVKGLVDDGDGTYTGSAGAIIENPADIIKFLLLNSYLGLGLAATDIDADTFTAVRASLAAAGLMLNITIDKETRVEEMIIDICRQARIQFYKNNLGKLCLHYPTALTAIDLRMNEGSNGGELLLLNAGDADRSDVVNAFDFAYNRDPLNQPLDPALIRRSWDVKLSHRVTINSASSSQNSEFHQQLCNISDDIFERREMVERFDYLDSETRATAVQEYYCERFTSLQRLATFRLPRWRWHDDIDVFTRVHLSAYGLPLTGGGFDELVTDNAGQELTVYYEGTPLVVVCAGVLNGEIVNVVEQGPFLTLTLETVAEEISTI